MKFALVFAIVCLGLSCHAQTNDAPKNITDSVAGPLKFSESDFLSVAQAMPEDKYSFVPTAGNFKDARSFAEQVKHVACAQFAFFNEIEGKTPPAGCEKGGPDPAKTKAELLKYLQDSFAYGDHVLASMDEKTLLTPVKGQYATPNTRIGMVAIAVWHLADHYGQIVEYLRMNGIVPPPTQQYPLKVH